MVNEDNIISGTYSLRPIEPALLSFTEGVAGTTGPGYSLEYQYCYCVIMFIESATQMPPGKTFTTLAASDIGSFSRYPPSSCNRSIIPLVFIIFVLGLALVMFGAVITERRLMAAVLLTFAFLYYVLVGLLLFFAFPAVCPGNELATLSQPYLLFCAAATFMTVGAFLCA